MSPTVSYGQSGKAFRYYVSASLQQGQKRRPGDDAVRRVSAPQLEALVTERIQRLFPVGDWTDMRLLLTRVELLSHSLHLSIQGASLFGTHGSNGAAVEALIRRLEPDDQLRIEPKQMLRLVIAMRPVFRGGRTWLVNPSGAGVVKKPRTDPQLAAGLRNAHAWLAQHSASPGAKPEVLRDASCPDGSYARRIVQLAFLAPDIQKAIIEGRQPPGLTMAEMLARGVPLAWADQRQRFGFPS